MLSKVIVNGTADAIREMCKARFPTRKHKFKINEKFYKEELITASVTAQALFIEEVIKSHGKNPYKEVDELIGDLQIIGAETLNYFQSSAAVKKCKPFKVEDYLTGGKFCRSNSEDTKIQTMNSQEVESAEM